MATQELYLNGAPKKSIFLLFQLCNQILNIHKQGVETSTFFVRPPRVHTLYYYGWRLATALGRCYVSMVTSDQAEFGMTTADGLPKNQRL